MQWFLRVSNSFQPNASAEHLINSAVGMCSPIGKIKHERQLLPDNAETRLVDTHVTLENSAVQCEITSSKMHSRLCCSHRETSGLQ